MTFLQDVLYGMAFKMKTEEVNEKFTNLNIEFGYSDMYGE